MTVENVLKSLKEWTLLKGTKQNPIPTDNLTMLAHINTLEVQLKDANDKVVELLKEYNQKIAR